MYSIESCGVIVPGWDAACFRENRKVLAWEDRVVSNQTFQFLAGPSRDMTGCFLFCFSTPAVACHTCSGFVTPAVVLSRLQWFLSSGFPLSFD